jgi:hypothetical protein
MKLCVLLLALVLSACDKPITKPSAASVISAAEDESLAALIRAGEAAIRYNEARSKAYRAELDRETEAEAAKAAQKEKWHQDYVDEQEKEAVERRHRQLIQELRDIRDPSWRSLRR